MGRTEEAIARRRAKQVRPSLSGRWAALSSASSRSGSAAPVEAASPCPAAGAAAAREADSLQGCGLGPSLGNLSSSALAEATLPSSTCFSAALEADSLLGCGRGPSRGKLSSSALAEATSSSTCFTAALEADSLQGCGLGPSLGKLSSSAFAEATSSSACFTAALEADSLQGCGLGPSLGKLSSSALAEATLPPSTCFTAALEADSQQGCGLGPSLGKLSSSAFAEATSSSTRFTAALDADSLQGCGLGPSLTGPSQNILLMVCHHTQAIDVARSLGFGASGLSSSSPSCAAAASAIGSSKCSAAPAAAAPGTAAWSGCVHRWAGLILRLLQVQRWEEDSSVFSSDSSDVPILVDTGSHSNASWASRCTVLLADLAPSDQPLVVLAGNRFITTQVLTTIDSPFQFVLPAGCRGVVKSCRSELEFYADIPSAVFECKNGCLLFPAAAALGMVALL
jgi:hypothetical protein